MKANKETFFRIFMICLLIAVPAYWYHDSQNDGYSFWWEGFTFLALEIFFLCVFLYALLRDSKPNLNNR